MARKQETRTIVDADGNQHTVKVGQMPVNDASVVLKKLAALLAAGGAHLPKGASVAELGEMDVSSLGEAVASMCRALPDDQQRALERDLLTNVWFDDKPLKDAVQALIDDLDVYYRVLAFSAEVNFARAFRVLVAGVGGPAVAKA